MKNQYLYLVLCCVLFIGSCASPESIERCVDPAQRDGFLFGLVHGFIAPVSFIISLFTDDVVMYAVNNSGWLYDLGFLLGIGGFSGGIFSSRRRKKRAY